MTLLASDPRLIVKLGCHVHYFRTATYNILCNDFISSAFSVHFPTN